MLTIRPATAADVPLILEFIRGLAEYERDPQAAVATAADLLRLKDLVQAKVRETFGIELQPEPVFVGFKEIAD